VIPFWHPLSTLLLPEPPLFATPAVLRMMLGPGAPLDLLYAGDRMWPAVRHGVIVKVRRLAAGEPRRGDVVVALIAGGPDLLRVAAVEEGGRYRLIGDADPGEGHEVARDSLLARAELPPRPAPRRVRSVRRIGLDLAEAWGDQARWRHGTAAKSVQTKYELQASFYAHLAAAQLPPAVMQAIEERGTSGARRTLVVGSGAGHECFALARAGLEVRGVDFSRAMVEQARQAASGQGLAVEFVHADVRDHVEPRASLDAIVFTYDVYSFLPAATDRPALLRKMAGWLRPQGVIYLSSRAVGRRYQRLILTLQWLRAGDPRSTWGASHTRYVAPDGALRRSFVHYFGARQLHDEIVQAGLRPGRCLGGHLELTPAPADGTPALEHR